MSILLDLADQLKIFLPNLVFTIIILVIGWIVSKIIARIIQKVLKTLKIDDLGDRLNDIDLIRKSNFTIIPSKIISKVVYYVLILMTLIVATEKLQVDAVTNLLTDFIGYLPNLLTAVIFFVIGLLVADAIRGVVLTTCESLGIPSSKVIASVVFYFIFLSVTMSALDQAKISTDFINSSLSIIIAGAVGAFALGYGLASKKMMANFLASFYTKGRFIIGDIVTVEGTKGEIIEMDNSSFVLKTENSKMVFPLSKLADKEIEIH